MIHRSFLLTLATALASATIPISAEAPHYTSLYVFGDSYCDVGNLHSPSSYYPDRWSNGPLWVDHIAGFLGLPLTPSTGGGTDYAWNGAGVTESNFSPSIPQQVDKYLADHDGKADPDALFILEGGANDVMQALQNAAINDPEELGAQIAFGLVNSEQRLREAGARHFVISKLIDVGRLPEAAPIAPFATAAAIATNRRLDILLSTEKRREGIQILRLDMFSLVSAIVKDPSHLGFTNVTDPCRTSNSACSDPDHLLFFDNAHLSEFAQSDLAVAVETLLTAQSEQRIFPERDL